MMLQNSRLNYLRNVMEVSRAVPIAALYLDLGVLPIRYEIDMRQLFFLKGILSKDPCDQVKLAYGEMKKFGFEKNWANNMFGLRKAYNIPLNDTNVQDMSHKDCKHLVKSTLVRHAFLELKKESAINKKTNHLEFVLLKPASCLFDLDPQFPRLIFKVRTRMFDIKVNFRKKYKQDEFCPFCGNGNENIQHVFSCENGVRHKRSLDNTTLYSISLEQSITKLREIAKHIIRYEKYCEILI